MTPAPPPKSAGFDVANLAVRVGSALVFAAFFLTLLYLGAQPWTQAAFLGILALATLMGVHEMVRMGRRMGANPSWIAATVAAWGILLHFYLAGLSQGGSPLPLWSVMAGAAVVIHFGALFFDKDLEKALLSQAVTWMAALYMGFGTGFILRLFMTQSNLTNTGGRLVLALFLITWMGDTSAYFVGSAFGRHKLARRVSPKKSWEGALGNLCGNVLAAFVMRATACPDWTPIDAVAIGLLLGVAGQLGDLAESTWKRSAGVKDSNQGGLAIPGHGGMLDRIDSLAFAAPAFYAYVHFVSGLN